IIDDPIKANDANSQVALAAVYEWFRDTARNRPDSPDSLFIVTMQRLHQRDLSGILIEKGWLSLVLPAIATETRAYLVGKNAPYGRNAGEWLPHQRDKTEDMQAKQRDMGSRVWGSPIPAKSYASRRKYHQDAMAGAL